MKILRSRYAVHGIAGLCLLLAAPATVLANQPGATGIVASIEKAPVVADGDVTGKPFDYVITFDGSQDPQVLGRGIKAGGTIRIYLPGEFDLASIDTENFPVATPPVPFPPVPPLPDKPCIPGNLQCTTAVILRGWPQDPLFPPVLFHTMSIDLADNAIVLTAARDIGLTPGETAAPYIKQVHLILNGLTNPAPGVYTVRVEAETGPDGSLESGQGQLVVRHKTKPSINITSVFVPPLTMDACGPGDPPPNPDNPIYQTTGVGEDAPFVWTFLLWGEDNEPLDNVWLHRVGRHHWLMLRNEDRRFRLRDIVGRLRVNAPRGARDFDVQLNNQYRGLSCPTLLPMAPVIAGTPGIGPQPVGRLDLQFTAGNKPGIYKTTLWMSGGNRVEMFVSAVGE